MTAAHKNAGASTRVYVEEGRKSVFVAALDWPGWCRRGANELDAIDELLDYANRYALVAGPKFEVGQIEVVGRVAGTATTDFGAPNVQSNWDLEPLVGVELQRHAELWAASWRCFDDVVSRSSATLVKGPRGGGRDRDQVVEHVRERERALAAKLGQRIAPRTQWLDQRSSIVATLLEGSPNATWPPRYAVRWGVWHILDHAWEIEDKQI